MGSIRPLVTITIILVAGAYLFVKINERPVAPVPGTADSWQSEAGIPPLATASGASSTTDTAPSWPAATPAPPANSAGAPFNSNSSAPATVDVATAAETLPAVPAIPELPEISATNSSPATLAPAEASIPTVLPANIPTAQYPDQPTANAPTASAPLSNQTLNSEATSTADFSSTANSTIPAGAPPVTSEPSAVPAFSSEAPLSQNPLRQSAPVPAAVDPYAPITVTPTQPPAATDTAATSFAASWPEIQAALDRGELSGAHKLLSKWYDDPSLTPADAEKVESILSQLAGSVVYSTEHQLEPAHVVQPGETLETIAKKHNVPWQLLAKINGVAAVDQIQPGQQLKVVPGPFSAIVDLRRSQLTLMVDGRYAGKFPVTVADGVALNEGEWIVQGKPATPYQSASTTPVLRQLVLTEADKADAAPGSPLWIGSQPSSHPRREQIGADGSVSTTAIPYVAVSPTAAEELSDILSIGSRVIIRR